MLLRVLRGTGGTGVRGRGGDHTMGGGGGACRAGSREHIYIIL